MKILVTGATGFLGSHICRGLLAGGREVRIFCRPSSSLANLQGLSVERAMGDVTDPESVRIAVQGCDAVIHSAAVLGYWSRDTARQAAVNIEGTRNVAQACRSQGVKRLVHISSVAAIGIPPDPHHPASEDFPFNLENTGLSYPLSKRRAEEVVLAEVSRGMNAVIVNPATIFGPHGSHYRGSEMIARVRQRAVVPYFTGGICVVHVQDVTDAIVAALERGASGQRYILGGENLTYRALAERAAAAMNLRRRFVPIGPVLTGLAAMILEPLGRLRNRRPRITYVTHYYASRYHFYDSSKARKTLGYAPRGFDAILEEALRSCAGGSSRAAE